MSSFEICAFTLFEGQSWREGERESERECVSFHPLFPLQMSPVARAEADWTQKPGTQSGSSKSMAGTPVFGVITHCLPECLWAGMKSTGRTRTRYSDVGCGCPRSLLTTRPSACPLHCLIILIDLITFKSYDPCLGLMSVLMGYSNSFYLELNICDL